MEQVVNYAPLWEFKKDTHTRTIKVLGKDCMFELKNEQPDDTWQQYDRIRDWAEERVKKWDLQEADEQHWKEYLNDWEASGLRFQCFTGEGDHSITDEPKQLLRLVVPLYNIDCVVGVDHELKQEEFNGIWYGIGRFVEQLQHQAHESNVEQVIFNMYDYDDFATENWIMLVNYCKINSCTIWDDKNYNGIPEVKFIVR